MFRCLHFMFVIPGLDMVRLFFLRLITGSPFNPTKSYTSPFDKKI